MSDAIKQKIIDHAKAIGFDCVAVTDAHLPDDMQSGLEAFIAANHHGTMDWLEARKQQRGSPEALWPEAKSVIMLGVNYGPDSDPRNDPMEKLARKLEANISVYAQNKDYHDLIKKRLKQLARWMVENFGGDVKVFVDTAPVMEKPLAAQAGLGWQGKHTNLVSRDFGSWLFLGSVFSTLVLTADEAERDHCGSCRNCLDICPTNAFPAPYKIDARRCISYLTIEHKETIPREFRKAIGNRIYGCDDCLAVCPWNKFAQTTSEQAFHPREALHSPLLAELAQLDDAAFRAMFAGSPIKRIGRDRFVRNVMIAIGNSQDATLLSLAEEMQEDASVLVADMARWAVQELTEGGRV